MTVRTAHIIRKLFLAAGTLVALMLVLLAAAFVISQTSWFKDKLRERVIAAIAEASGGTVELGAFDYNWRTLTANFRNLVVRGTETRDTAPLFRADSIRLGLRIVSFFERDIDISSLTIEHPQIHVVAAEGTTNIPSPSLGRHTAGETIQALLNLKVRHFEFRDGSVQLDARSLPLSARGDGLFVQLTYQRRRPRYNITIRSQQVQVDSPQWQSAAVQLEAIAELEKDRVIIRQARLIRGASRVDATGAVRRFARPIADAQITSHFEVADIAALTHFSALRAGEVTLSGNLHYDSSTALRFSGAMAGRNLNYTSRAVALKNVDFQSDVAATPQEATFTRMSLSAFGAHLNGRAALSAYQNLQFDGTLSGLSIRDAGALLTQHLLPWSGIATGAVQVSASLRRRTPNFAIETKLRIAPGSTGVPLSGDVDIRYKSTGNVLELGDSHLVWPQTQVTLSGVIGTKLRAALTSRNLSEIQPAIDLLDSPLQQAQFPALLANGNAHFDGSIVGPLREPQITGDVSLSRFRLSGATWDAAKAHVSASSSNLELSGTTLDRGAFHGAGNLRLGLNHWKPDANGPLRLQARFTGADLAGLALLYPVVHLPLVGGVASGRVDVAGSFLAPQGSAQLDIRNLDAYGEALKTVQMTATFAGDVVRIERGRMEARPALLSFGATYTHAPQSWSEGDAQLTLNSNAFPLASLGPARAHMPGWNAAIEVHISAAAHVAAGRLEPQNANGTIVFRHLAMHDVPYGDIEVQAATHGTLVDTSFSGDLRGSHVGGSAKIQLTAGNATTGEIRLDRMQLSTLSALFTTLHTQSLPLAGSLSANLSFQGPLQQPRQWRSKVEIGELQLASNISLDKDNQEHPSDLIFHNLTPIVFEASNGIATVRSFELGGKDTRLSVTGSIPYLEHGSTNLSVNGSVDLGFFQLLDPNVRASGESVVAASVRGTIADPSINGTVQLKNGAFALPNVPNGLTAVNGTVKFDRDRATIEQLTAQTGGGQLSLAGLVTFGNGPLVYRLEAKADNVRVRYAGGVSATANSDLRLTGTSENSILSGTATISRAVLTPNTDVGNLLASAGAPVESPANEKDFLTGLQFDVRIQSAPNLQFNTALSRDLQASIDLRLRGTPAHPILLGTVSANQGDIRVFGTRYNINRGEVSFVNPVRIEPVLNLDLETLVHGIVVDITLSGSLPRLNITYRSDPPLQPRDIIALLAVGHTPDVLANRPNAPVTNDISAFQSGANSLLGQAISPSSNRLSKLFGVTNIKIDPLVQGITNTPQARLTIEQSVSPQITVTYVTNLAQTSEQIFRLEWAFSPQYSVVAVRDDNGEFGIDVQYRKRFK